MIPRMCQGCGLKPQAYHQRGWCYDCKPGSKGRPLPCRRCGSRKDYWSQGLCRRCHQYAPQLPDSCRDCLAWGARRTERWLCKACLSWRYLHPRHQPCLTCGDHRSVNEHDVCRLCWKQVKLVQERLPHRHRGPLNLHEATRGGQQLFLANIDSPKNGYRPPPPRPQTLPAATPPRRRRRQRSDQLDLFTPDPLQEAARRYGFGGPPSTTLAIRLDQAASDHASRHGWSQAKTRRVRVALQVLQAMRHITHSPIAASQTAHLIPLDLPAQPVLAVLASIDLLDDDRPDGTQAWFQSHTGHLPDDMRRELQTWFDVLRHGSHTPPRSRPRQPSTITTRLRWALPTLELWAAAGHQSLRDIDRHHVLAVLPTTGTPRVELGSALRSIFATLKAHKVIFVNPLSRITIGNFERRTPLPTDHDRLDAALHTTDPPGAALAALVIFHGLRPAELRDLKTTDIHDSRLHLPDRTIPLADPVLTRLRAYRTHRERRWPNSINPHLFIHPLNAGATHPASREWVNAHLGMPARRLRQHRIVDEAVATGGDLRRICDFFGVTMATAEHYASVLNHTALDTDRPPASTSPPTPAPSRAHHPTPTPEFPR